MTHTFPYPDIPAIDVPESRLIGSFSMAASAVPSAAPETLVAAALRAPVGSAPLHHQVKPGMGVVIVVDDITRTTRTDVILPAVISELESTGVDPGAITVFVAIGTHRPMTPTEMIAKYGGDTVSRCRFVQPSPWNVDEYQEISGRDGFTARVHRSVLAADYVIGIGQVAPHLIAGFGGGCKIINPGCCDEQTIGQMHWLCTKATDGNLFAVRDNPVRAQIDEVGLQAGLRFIVNEVPGADDTPGAMFAGDPVYAHRAACSFARLSCSIRISEAADIVIADSYPADLDFWQSLKGLNAACSAVKPNGTVVFVTPCREGVSREHPELVSVGFRRSPGEIEAMVRDGRLDPVVAAAIWLGTRMAARARVILVSGGISEAEARHMGFHHSATPAEALAHATTQHGPASRIVVLYKAAKMICSTSPTSSSATESTGSDVRK